MRERRMRVVIAQIPVGREVASNREAIGSLLARAVAGDWVVFPEGALTGYFPGGADYLAKVEPAEAQAAIEGLHAVVARRRCHALVGTARFVSGAWRNSAVLLSHGGEVRWYDKNVLNPLDSRHFGAGDGLPVWEVDGVRVGVQICWELLFPQQWARLKRDGAQIVFHLNNAVKPEDAVWEHLLRARAFENRYFVASANNAASPQALPSYLIAPSGKTLLRSEPRVEQALGCVLDLSQVESAWSWGRR